MAGWSRAQQWGRYCATTSQRGTEVATVARECVYGDTILRLSWERELRTAQGRPTRVQREWVIGYLDQTSAPVLAHELLRRVAQEVP